MSFYLRFFSIVAYMCTVFLTSGWSTEPEEPVSVTWDINSLTEIGGHMVEVSGNPQVVTTEMGEAVEFDGDSDRLLVDNNPIGDAKEFTVEVYFKPADAYAISNEPRFIHIQDPDDPEAKRVMIELRLTEAGKWYLDGFMKTDADDLPLIDESLVHPTEDWMHAAITYKNDTFRTYVNGVHELTGTVGYNSSILNSTGKTSIGARMNLVNFYAGIVKTLRITHKALEEGAFLIDEEEEEPVPTAVLDNYLPGFRIIAISNTREEFIDIEIQVGNNQRANIYLFNTLGARLLTRNAELQKGTNRLRFDTGNLPDGVYMVSAILDGKNHTSLIRF